MSSGYIGHKFLKKDTVEYRDYQVHLANHAKLQNSLIVLPTGLGKTTVALQVIVDYLSKGTGGVLFLAPTRVLSSQHYQFLKNNVTLEDIALITGEDNIGKRKKAWLNSVICATPEITKNDLDRQIVSPRQFNLVIFDEAHRAIGDYAYAGIAERFVSSNTRIMGLTATLPSEREKAAEILTKLRITSVIERTDESPDVKPYIQETTTQWINVELPPEMKKIQTFLKKALDQRYTELRRNGVHVSDTKSLSQLLRLREYVLRQNRRSAKPLFTAIRIHYALNILESHGIMPFLRFCERTKMKKGIGIRDLFENDPNFTQAVLHAKEAQQKGVEHSKISKLIEILNKIHGKALVFTSYRDSVELIHGKLTQMGIDAGFLIGKAGESGLKQKKQIETVQNFRDGLYKVLIATRVGEEGLDISEVNYVIFYDNVPSSIRFVQRRGRTGRKDAGKLIVLITKNTIDETYYWIGRRKITAARGMGQKMSQTLQNAVKSKAVLDSYF